MIYMVPTSCLSFLSMIFHLSKKICFSIDIDKINKTIYNKSKHQNQQIL